MTAHFIGPITFLVLVCSWRENSQHHSTYDLQVEWTLSIYLTLYREMASSRASNVSEFRQVLSRLKDLHEKLERSDQSSLAAKLSDINDSLSIIEGNQTDFSDTVLQTLERIHSTMVNGFKTMEDRISTLEAKLTSHETGSYDAVTPPNSSRKRKIARHPDLSVRYVNIFLFAISLRWEC